MLVNSLRKEVELEESKSADVDRFLSVVERYTDIPELTPCILHEVRGENHRPCGQRPKGQESDAGDRHLLQGYRSLGNVKSHGINGKMRKRYSRSYTVLSFLTMFSYRELPFGGLFQKCYAAEAGADRLSRPKQNSYHSSGARTSPA